MRPLLAALAVIFMLPMSGCWNESRSEEARRDASFDQILESREAGAKDSPEVDPEETEGYAVEEAEQHTSRGE